MIDELSNRRPYVMRKSREKWTADEHSRFLEGLNLYGRNWKKVTEHVHSKTRIQVRSHAQKYFIRIEKEQAASTTAADSGSSSSAGGQAESESERGGEGASLLPDPVVRLGEFPSSPFDSDSTPAELDSEAGEKQEGGTAFVQSENETFSLISFDDPMVPFLDSASPQLDSANYLNEDNVASDYLLTHNLYGLFTE